MSDFGPVSSVGNSDISMWEDYKKDIIGQAKKIAEGTPIRTRIGGRQVLMMKRHIDAFSGDYICLLNLEKTVWTDAAAAAAELIYDYSCFSVYSCSD